MCAAVLEEQLRIGFLFAAELQDHRHRRAAEREAARRTEAQKLQALLEQGGSDAAVEAAENVLRKYRPEVLKESYDKMSQGMPE